MMRTIRRRNIQQTRTNWRVTWPADSAHEGETTTKNKEYNKSKRIPPKSSVISGVCSKGNSASNCPQSCQHCELTHGYRLYLPMTTLQPLRLSQMMPFKIRCRSWCIIGSLTLSESSQFFLPPLPSTWQRLLSNNCLKVKKELAEWFSALNRILIKNKCLEGVESICITVTKGAKLRNNQVSYIVAFSPRCAAGTCPSVRVESAPFQPRTLTPVELVRLGYVFCLILMCPFILPIQKSAPCGPPNEVHHADILTEVYAIYLLLHHKDCRCKFVSSQLCPHLPPWPLHCPPFSHF